jgi:O-antigen/teichoic acid export membrane protein
VELHIDFQKEKEEEMDKRIIAICGLLASIFSIISSLVAVRFYSNYFGSNEYGLIGAPIILVAIIQFLDLGLSTYTNRVFYNKENEIELISLIIVYLFVILVATFFTIAIFLYANKISSVKIIAALFATCFTQACNVYLSNLMILNGRQLYSYLIQFIFSIVLVSASGIVVNYNFQIEETLLVISVINLLRMIVLMGCNNLIDVRFWVRTISELRKIKNLIKKSFETYKMNLVIGLGFQADKYVAASLMPMSALGGYSMINQFANGATLFAPSISNYFSSELVKNKSSRATSVAKTLKLLGNIAIPIFIVIVINMDAILMLWLGNAQLVQKISLPALFLTAGAMLNTLTIPFFGYLIAEKSEKEMRYMFTKMLILCVPITLLLVSNYELIGVSISYTIYNAMYVFLISKLVNKSKVGRQYIEELLSRHNLIEISANVGFNVMLSIILYYANINSVLCIIFSFFGLLLSVSVFLIKNKSAYE